MASENYWQKAGHLSRVAELAFRAIVDFLESSPDLDEEDVRIDYWELQCKALVAAEPLKAQYEESLIGRSRQRNPVALMPCSAVRAESESASACWVSAFSSCTDSGKRQSV